MRGPPVYPFRSGAKPPSANEAQGQSMTLPAPYEGWNANGNLSAMRPLQAVQMDNIFPDVTDVGLRRGSSLFASGIATPIKTLHAYEGLSASKLFASTTTGVFNVSAGGVIGAADFACTSGRWISVNYANSGGSFLVMVNETDSLRVYNGATWQAITGVSVPAITGVATTSLASVSLHKKRLWFVESSSMNLWYLPVDAYAGAASLFPVGALFKRGGKLLCTGSWTLDSGSGSDDYFVIITTKGEMAVYQGTDPADAAKWALVGVYEVGLPVGDRPLCDFGGDLLYLSENGLFPLSKFVQSTVVDRTSAISFLVQGAYLPMVEAYRALNGWEVLTYRRGNFLLINLPTATDTYSVQYVMNLTTKAWCRFTNWNAVSFAESNGNLYFAVGGNVYQAWTGTSDSGVAIQGDVIQAYNGFRLGGEKQISLVRPHISYDGSMVIRYSIDTDFRAYDSTSQITYVTDSGTGIWDSSTWDHASWTVGVTPIRPVWTTVNCEIGFLHAFRLQIISTSAVANWTATNFLYVPAGIL